MPKFNITLSNAELLILLSNIAATSSFPVIFKQVKLTRKQLLFLINQSGDLAYYIINNTKDKVVIKAGLTKWQRAIYEGTDFEILKFIVDRNIYSFSRLRQTEEISLYVAKNGIWNAITDFHNPSEEVQKAIVDSLCEKEHFSALKKLKSLGYTIDDYINKRLMLL